MKKCDVVVAIIGTLPEPSAEWWVTARCAVTARALERVPVNHSARYTGGDGVARLPYRARRKRRFEGPFEKAYER